jgi:hypothetical protein
VCRGNGLPSRVRKKLTGTAVRQGSELDDLHADSSAIDSERNGRWGKAIEVPGLGALNKGGAPLSARCRAPRRAAARADGSYTDRRGHFQGFVVSQTR